MAEPVTEHGFFVKHEFWTLDEWANAVSAADWLNRAARIARDYEKARRQVWAREHRLACAQRASMKEAA